MEGGGDNGDTAAASVLAAGIDPLAILSLLVSVCIHNPCPASSQVSKKAVSAFALRPFCLHQMSKARSARSSHLTPFLCTMCKRMSKIDSSSADIPSSMFPSSSPRAYVSIFISCPDVQALWSNLLCQTGLLYWLLSGPQFSTQITSSSPFDGGNTTDTENGFKHQHFISPQYNLLYPVSPMHNTHVPLYSFVIGQGISAFHASSP